jgi:hypothetical protein
VTLVATEQVAVDPGHRRDARVAAGEVSESLEVVAVLGDRAVGGVPVELEPAEVLLDGLGQRDLGSHSPPFHR